MKLSIITAALALVLCGCASYSHTRPNGETTSFRTFLMMGNASKIRASTKDGTYTRTLSVGAVQGQGDTDLVKALVEAGGTAAAAGAKAAIKP